MYVLIKSNVERHVNTESERDKLIKKGYLIHGEYVNNKEEKALQSMSLKEIRKLAKEKDIESADTLTKEELLVLLGGE